MKSANKIELHYFLRDETHTMNAFVRNECEKELLTIFKEIIISLDIEIDVESEAFKEGGLKEIWNFLGKNGVQLTLIITVFGLVLSRIPVENKELVKLQIENLELDNELKKQELKKIKNEVRTEEELTDETVERVLEILDRDYKIIWHKSNFYKKLNFYPKVTKLTTQKLNEQNEPVEKERTVERELFGKFILRSDTFPPYIDEEAVIDIISPVLKKGNFNWKGFYKGDIINFEMNDQNFKNSVLNKEIEFINGTAIKCVLQQNRKIDEVGLVKVIQNKVLTVIEIITGENYVPTEQGKKYKRDKERKNDQLKLDF
ncbi:MAG: hypothetical protein A3H98_00570 [Bacteroidetes bacterium RIFCSPLOWO2_02_FULL_36_8]|nr:MAG: hypothetical protein A3H98_00570 [Bacteroidetes bacterium RIFCSPLOWO2_02_FULL_36_8]OFY69455.1 MAG: hypothetical protein A3G23_00640 [Bacteroidetes bacterium RIFCSPLOWO2_12_FULL_37_12]